MRPAARDRQVMALDMRAASALSMRPAVVVLRFRRLEQRVSRSPYSPISCAAVFTPMPGTPGTLSNVADQRLDLDNPVRHTPILDDLRNSDARVLHRVV